MQVKLGPGSYFFFFFSKCSKPTKKSHLTWKPSSRWRCVPSSVTFFFITFLGPRHHRSVTLVWKLTFYLAHQDLKFSFGDSPKQSILTSHNTFSDSFINAVGFKCVNFSADIMKREHWSVIALWGYLFNGSFRGVLVAVELPLVAKALTEKLQPSSEWAHAVNFTLQ